MALESNGKIKLGAFVLTGTLLLIVALYLVGTKQNLFGSTFKLNAQFYNVNGLMKGNNVRFAGIDVGTVESVEIINDSAVNVVMVLEKKVQPFIKKSATAGVGTDGLMGNKLININYGDKLSAMVEDGDFLKTERPVEMDEVIKTLNVTNENIMVITGNLRKITDKINSRNSLWNVLLDTAVAENVKSSVVNIREMSNRALLVTGDLREISAGLKSGKGTLGALITDTVLSSGLKQAVVKINRLSDTAAIVTGDISRIMKTVKDGKGTIGVLLNDTALVTNLNKSMENLKSGSAGFNDNMEALKHTWPFKKYFKKKKK